MAGRSTATAASLAHKLAHCSPVPCVHAVVTRTFRPTCSLLHHPTLSSFRFFRSSPLRSLILSPATTSQSDPDPTLLPPLSPEEAPATLKAALDPALWFPDAEPVPAPPTASEVAAAADPSTASPASDAAGSGDGSAETGGLYFTSSNPLLHPVAPIAEAVAPLPCAYTPPDIAPTMSVEDIKKAMESIIVQEDDGAEAGKEEGPKAVEVKGLEELLEDVQADEAASKGSAMVVAAA